MVLRRACAFGLFVAVTLVAGQAHADVIDPAEGECRGKSEGDACGVGNVCAAATCSRNDYSNGPPPTVRSVDCLKCQPRSAANKADEPAKTSDEPPPVEEKSGGCRVADVPPPLAMTLGLGLLVWARRRQR